MPKKQTDILTSRLDYFEVWASTDHSEWIVFSPDNVLKTTYNKLIKDDQGHLMKRVACIKSTYMDAKIVMEDILKQEDQDDIDRMLG